MELGVWIIIAATIVASAIARNHKEEDAAKAMERYINECNKEESK